MRDIEFRAKRIDMDRWVYGQYVITPLTDENSGTTPDKGWFFLTGESRHCIIQNHVAFVIDLSTLGQFTGLKDKNGKEIYEGDIVRAKFQGGYSNHFVDTEQLRTVKYNAQKACWSPFDHCRMWVDDDGQPTAIEVIGNIYENPKLLKEPTHEPT